MRRVVAGVVMFCFLIGLAMATEPVPKPGVISMKEIRAAAKTVAEESTSAQNSKDGEEPLNAPTGMSTGTWVVIILVAVVVIGGILYLAYRDDEVDFGDGTLFGKTRRESPRQYQHRFLRQHWQTR